MITGTICLVKHPTDSVYPKHYTGSLSNGYVFDVEYNPTNKTYRCFVTHYWFAPSGHEHAFCVYVSEPVTDLGDTIEFEAESQSYCVTVNWDC